MSTPGYTLAATTGDTDARRKGSVIVQLGRPSGRTCPPVDSDGKSLNPRNPVSKWTNWKSALWLLLRAVAVDGVFCGDPVFGVRRVSPGWRVACRSRKSNIASSNAGLRLRLGSDDSLLNCIGIARAISSRGYLGSYPRPSPTAQDWFFAMEIAT